VSEPVDSWNDDRIDDLAKEVKDGFEKVDREMKDGFTRVDREMKAGFAKVDARFATIDARFEKTPTREEMNKGFADLRSDFNALNRTLIASAAGTIGTLIAGIIALIVTHA